MLGIETLPLRLRQTAFFATPMATAKIISIFTTLNSLMEMNGLIERNPDVMLGKPVIKGTRITVELIVRKIAGGYSIDDLLKAYPHVTKQQIQASLEFAADVVANEEIITTT